MAYVPKFEFDIFISYAHVDNLTTPGESQGWIETFQKFLEVFLSRRVGRIGSVEIWRDPTLDGSQLFDQTIENRIQKSAVFLAFKSPPRASWRSWVIVVEQLDAPPVTDA